MTIPHALQIAVRRHQAGRLAEAEAIYRQILAVQPNHAEARHLLGVIADQAGRHDLAMEWIRQAIVLDPNNPFAHSNLGEACRKLGRLDEAITNFRRALELKPDYPKAHYNLANVLRDRGQIDEAVAAYRRALQFEPGFPEARNNLGLALQGQGKLDEAIAMYRRALEIKPALPECYCNLGSALAGQGLFDEAIAAYRQALELRPNYSEACNNLGNVLRDRGRPDEAVAAFQRALELNPGYSEAHNNLGNALRDRNRLDEAIAAYRRALEIQPNYPEAHNNLGNAFRDRGDLDEAIAAYRQAVALKPEHPGMHSNLVYMLHFLPDRAPASTSEEHHRWNRQFSEPLKRFILPHANDRNAQRRLRVGYVSPDFRDHVVGRYTLPLLERHDREQFEILCYSGVGQPDWMTERFRALAAEWRTTVGVSDARLAEMIRQDGIDILVDLTQHMAGNRLPMFARKPAPVQVSFAGYPETTGLDAIGRRISDRYLEAGSADERTGMNERVHLVDSFWCYDPSGAEVEVNPPPAVQSGTVTFGSMNNFCKVNAQVLSLWARVLGATKGSRLVISSRAGSHRQRTLEALEREGVGTRRVEFVEFRPRREYLELYHRLDIVLDTFPYNGGVTTCDALWMGVPVVTLAGHTPVSRAGLSLLTNLGLPELVARSESEYVKIAEDLAANLPRLAQLRATLRARMEASPVMDAPRFTRQVEQAYRSMWEQWRVATG